MQVRNTEGEKNRLVTELAMMEERVRQIEEILAHKEMDVELLQEERRKREKEWTNVVSQVESKSRELEEELVEMREEVGRLEEERASLRGRAVVADKEHKEQLETLGTELEAGRSSLIKKIHQLEAQIEEEQTTWARLGREKRAVEERLAKVEEAQLVELGKFRMEARKKSVLLKDSQAVVDRLQVEGGNRQVVRQLKSQLEEAEHARTAALRSKRHADLEVEDVNQQLEEVSKGRARVEEKLALVIRENTELSARLQDGEEEMVEVMRKYRASVAAMGTDQITLQDQATTIQELEGEQGKLREKVGELEGRLEHAAGSTGGTEQGRRAELRLAEMEQRLELEATNRQRLEGQVTRLREVRDRLDKVRLQFFLIYS